MGNARIIVDVAELQRKVRSTQTTVTIQLGYDQVKDQCWLSLVPNNNADDPDIFSSLYDHIKDIFVLGERDNININLIPDQDNNQILLVPYEVQKSDDEEDEEDEEKNRSEPIVEHMFDVISKLTTNPSSYKYVLAANFNEHLQRAKAKKNPMIMRAEEIDRNLLTRIEMNKNYRLEKPSFESRIQKLINNGYIKVPSFFERTPARSVLALGGIGFFFSPIFVAIAGLLLAIIIYNDKKQTKKNFIQLTTLNLPESMENVMPRHNDITLDTTSNGDYSPNIGPNPTRLSALLSPATSPAVTPIAGSDDTTPFELSNTAASPRRTLTGVGTDPIAVPRRRSTAATLAPYFGKPRSINSSRASFSEHHSNPLADSSSPTRTTHVSETLTGSPSIRPS